LRKVFTIARGRIQEGYLRPHSTITNVDRLSTNLLALCGIGHKRFAGCTFFLYEGNESLTTSSVDRQRGTYLGQLGRSA